MLIEKMQELTSAQFTVWDYHFQAANTNPAATVQVPQPVKIGEVSHSFEIGGNSKFEDYRHGDFAHHFDAINQEGTENSQVSGGPPSKKHQPSHLAHGALRRPGS